MHFMRRPALANDQSGVIDVDCYEAVSAQQRTICGGVR